MLRPHDREDAELDKIRLSAKRFQDALIFFVGQAVVGNDLRSDWRLLHGGVPSEGSAPSLAVGTRELFARPDQDCRASVGEVREADALRRPGFVANAPEVVPDGGQRDLRADPKLATALDHRLRSEPRARVDVRAGKQ